MTATPPMTLVADEHIPPQMIAYLRARGHVIHLVTQSTIKGEADEVVCALAEQLGGVVLTFNHRHYARLLARIPQSGKLRFPTAGRISFTCAPSETLARLQAVIEDIEEEFAKAQLRADKRLLVTIDKLRFSFER
jgi:hypothetical protein